MCGIVGVLRFGQLDSVPNRLAALFLATDLLKSSRTRGKQATGVTALFDDGFFLVQKMGVESTEFISRSGGTPNDFEGLMAILRTYDKAPMRCLLGHCRKKSSGGFNNTDNHPIKAGNIIGVHNGTLKNDDKIFENLGGKRDGDVDSEAIFRLLQFFTRDSEDPFTLDTLESTCTRLDGTYSILAMNANNPNQIAAARDGRPAEYCLIKPLKLVLVASEVAFIDHAIWQYNLMARLFPTGNEQTAFVPIAAEDVEYITPKDNTSTLFNLTREISPDTKLTDLYETRSIPFSVVDGWKEPTTYGYNTGGYYHGYNPNAKKTNTPSTTTGTTKTTTTKPTGKSQSTETTGANEGTGRVWSDSLSKFVPVGEQKNDSVFEKKAGADGVIIDVTTNKTASVKDTANQADKAAKDLQLARKQLPPESKQISNKAIELTEVNSYQATSVEKYDPACAVQRSITINTVESKPYANNSTIVTEPKKTTDVSIVTKELEKGAQASKVERDANSAATLALKQLHKFKDLSDVAELIDIVPENISALEVPSLTNRIIKNVFRSIFIRGFCDGYQKAQKEDKLLKAQKHIRVLKTIGTCADAILEDPSVISTGIKQALLTTVKEFGKQAHNNSKEFTSDAISEVFNSQDVNNSAVLKCLTADN